MEARQQLLEFVIAETQADLLRLRWCVHGLAQRVFTACEPVKQNIRQD